MRVHVKKGASKSYEGRMIHSYKSPISQSYSDMLKKIEDTWVEIETEFLFVNQYNTAPIPGVSENGLRLYAHDVDAIEDDARDYMMRCNYCGKCSPKGDVCGHCGESKYLDKFEFKV